MMVSVSVVIHSDVEHSAVYDCPREQRVMIKRRIDSCSHSGMMSSGTASALVLLTAIGCSGSRWCVG